MRKIFQLIQKPSYYIPHSLFCNKYIFYTITFGQKRRSSSFFGQILYCSFYSILVTTTDVILSMMNYQGRWRVSSQTAIHTKARYLCVWNHLTVLYRQLLMNELSVIVSVSNKDVYYALNSLQIPKFLKSRVSNNVSIRRLVSA